MAVYRVTAEWSGFTGAPGYSNFHFGEFTGGADIDQMRNRVGDFFQALYTNVPSSVSISIPPTVEVYDEASGLLTGYEEGGEEITIEATGTVNTYAGPSGAVVNWLTNTVANGRRIRGRTFIVPLRTTAYQSDGTLTSDTLEDIRAAAAGLVQDDFNTGFSVWSRPQNGGSGVLAPVTGYRVPDLAAVLRSRRD